MNIVQKMINGAQIEEVDIPTGLVNYLEKRTRRISYFAIPSRYSVTDIVGCQRKTYYKSLKTDEEELLNDATVETMWDEVRGNLLHQITYAYKWREMDIDYDVMLTDGKQATLSGRLDMYDWKTATVIDLKTTKYVKWQIKQGFLPKYEHILQLQCYDTMFSRVMPVENLNILYVDMNDIVAYKIQKRNLTDWIRIRVQGLENSLSNKKIPKGEVTGLCKYCKYQTKCYNDGEGLITKPLSIPKNKSNHVSIDGQITETNPEQIEIEQSQKTRGRGQLEKVYTTSYKEAI
jgi:CRISPR/Cas system-associated exonuclease Cas4 (RecB family)